jgi:17 kDa outer membrane surface antigen
MRRLSATTLIILALIILALLAGCAPAQHPPSAAPSGLAPPRPVPLPPPALPPTPPLMPLREEIDLNEQDRLLLETALRSLAEKPLDQPVAWNNPASGRQGSLRALRDGFEASNRPCREFHALTMQGPLQRHSLGILCRNADGVWAVAAMHDYPTRKEQG